MTPEYLSRFGGILIFILGGIAFVLLVVGIARMIRPNRPDENKLSPYECGEDPVGNVWTNFNVRFYLVALLFLLFEVELVLLFPWAVLFSDAESLATFGTSWIWISITEITLFLGMLIAGLAYAWRKGYLAWVKPDPKPETIEPVVPGALYEEINRQYERKK
ncbi:MAG: NADH-quinone oxidoreductase subunit A [Cytophagaceae bacterium]|jgi:NADH-quinone oxidoreductase subunit A|nr:NADH-quinone oxidoreductase subunit A [Cytophagaceae bacterium]